MVEDEKRRRAPAMSPEERRAAIVASTIPLLLEHGGTVSTSQIAAAAGIAEGTVFRAFKDKQDLLIACMQAGLNSDAEVQRIAAIGLDEPLHARLAEGVRAVSGYLDRIWAIGQALRAGGVGQEAMQRRMHGDDEEQPPGPPPEILRVSQAMKGLFDERTDNLRVDTDGAVRMLLSLVLSNRMQGAGFGAPIDEPAVLVDLLLHGVVHREEPR
ncbi:TetR/AcrR family transcriptional regulator [Actinophytocola oryzae]|uniref:TetR family transcriptional regulator n=1 Tax=Actinophytocola oryzae TaxID=502181 RepID=A0A4R7UT48_9PSEU|nr:TetR family transcriptional regulator [Actinophytocola oryzae]TDV38755.1 TetR family transcriptional regulator [Actinophytocola oryzae]